MAGNEPLIPRHGGYRKLKIFQMAQLAFDVTVHFCERCIDKFSRTRDLMTQAARSGVQNIAETDTLKATLKKLKDQLKGTTHQIPYRTRASGEARYARYEAEAWYHLRHRLRPI